MIKKKKKKKKKPGADLVLFRTTERMVNILD